MATNLRYVSLKLSQAAHEAAAALSSATSSLPEALQRGMEVSRGWALACKGGCGASSLAAAALLPCWLNERRLAVSSSGSAVLSCGLQRRQHQAGGERSSQLGREPAPPPLMFGAALHSSQPALLPSPFPGLPPAADERDDDHGSSHGAHPQPLSRQV